MPCSPRKNAIWLRMSHELVELLDSDHNKDRRHLDKVEFDI